MICKMMTYENIPEAFQIKLRVAIIAALYNGEKDFNILKELLGTTDGNLSIQMSKLETWQYIESRKIIGKRKTIYTITDYGKDMFKEYVELLTKSIND